MPIFSLAHLYLLKKNKTKLLAISLTFVLVCSQLMQPDLRQVNQIGINILHLAGFKQIN